MAVEGYFVDRFRPKLIVMFGGALTGIAWTMNASASSLSVLYVAQAIGGIGAGAFYSICIGNTFKWFADPVLPQPT